MWILFILYPFCKSYEFSYSPINPIIYDTSVKDTFDTILSNPKSVILFSSMHHTPFKENLLSLKCIHYGLSYQKITYQDFIFNNFNKKQNVIYIEDFLIDNGQLIHEKEYEYLLEYNEKPKLILNIETENLVVKNDFYIKQIHSVELPKIVKRVYRNYIEDIIEYYDYDKRINHVSWSKYDMEHLSFHDIEDLVFKIHVALQLRNDVDNNYIDKLIITTIYN